VGLPCSVKQNPNFWFVRFVHLWYIQTFGGKMTPQKFGKLILTLIVAALMISACGGANASPTPTEVSLEAVYTAAAATVFASGTGTAGAQPSKTLSPTATISLTPTVTGTPTATRAAAVYVQPVIVAVNTTTGTPWTLTPSSGAVGCNNSVVVEDIAVPNMKAGETFTKTWKIKNNGTCAWNANYKFTYIGGDLMNSDTTKIRTVVGIGGTYNQNLKFTAPNAAGTYTGNWRLADDKGVLFGSVFSVVVTVPGATNTPTKAITATPTGTATLPAAYP
jgi:hypothetical protein